MIEPDRALAEEFLAVIDSTASRFTFQIFDDGPNKRLPTPILHGSLDELWQVLVNWSQRGAGIFVTVNETDGVGRKASNIVRVRALFADLDGAPLTVLARIPLDLAWVSETSPGRFHAFWLVEEIELHEFTDLQKEIIRKTGSDPVIHDLPRVMRLPGFPHLKRDPFLVTGKARKGAGQPHIRDALLAALQPPKTRSKTVTARLSGSATDRRYALAALEGEAEAVATAPEGCRNDTLNKAAFCVARFILSGDLLDSEVEAVLTAAALAAGLCPNEISTTLGSGVNARLTEAASNG